MKDTGKNPGAIFPHYQEMPVLTSAMASFNYAFCICQCIGLNSSYPQLA